MKKWFIGLLCLCMMLTLAACQKTDTIQNNSESDLQEEITFPETNKQENEITTSEKESEVVDEMPVDTGRDVLVVYFSCTNTTAPLAEYAAEYLNADIYEIVPVQPYTDEDINYNDDNCRANKEQNDDAARPEIAGDTLDLTQYSTIVIAHPIWWGEEPRIIDTFIESYDFSGKDMAVFVTSGGSGVDTAYTHLQEKASNANWLGAERFSGDASAEDIKKWLDSIGINLEN